MVPVINENDTTTTDEITFGDNDFLAAQVAILLGADLLVLLTDTDGLYTADPRIDPTRRAGPEVTRLRGARALEIGMSTSPLGSGGMRSKVVAAEMATAAGIPAAIARARRRGGALPRWRGEARRHALPPAGGARVSSFKLWLRVREAHARGG